MNVRIATLFVGLSAAMMLAEEPKPALPACVALLEDNAEALLQCLRGGPGAGHVERSEVYSGREAIRITPMQRYERVIPNWKYRIVENPGPGEYRYVRFAWKADGCVGIMLQLHDERDWNIRYTAGRDAQNWGTMYVDATPPDVWTVVTRDVYKDVGARTITGIALTAHEGRAGYFDHIYFGRTLDELDRIDATGLRADKPVELRDGDLERLWGELSHRDSAIVYRAFWTLTAAPDAAAPFLLAKLHGPPNSSATARIQSWIRELDDESFAVRQRATVSLAGCVEVATAALERELAESHSAEVKARILRVLGGRTGAAANRKRADAAFRILEYAAAPAARHALEHLANGSDPRLARTANAAVARINSNSPPSK